MQGQRFGKKEYTNGEILLILISSILVISAIFLFINIYIQELNGTNIFLIASNDGVPIQIRTDVIFNTGDSGPASETRDSRTPEPTPVPSPAPSHTPTPEPSTEPSHAPEPSDGPYQSIAPQPSPGHTQTPAPERSERPTPLGTPDPTPEPRNHPTPTEPPAPTPNHTAKPPVEPTVKPSEPPVLARDNSSRMNVLPAKKNNTWPGTYYRDSILCVVEGKVSYSRSNVDFDRFFISVAGKRGEVAEDGNYSVSVSRTGSEEILLGFDRNAIFRVPIELDSGAIRKDLRISKIVPALMLRRYGNDTPDSSIFKPIPEQVFYRGNEGLARVAITIDDGFVRDEKLLAFLKKHGVRCTVFVIGGRNIAAAHPEWIAEMDRMGFEVANHTYTHSAITLLSDSTLEREIRDTQRIISRVTKKAYPYFRPPGGAFDKRTLAVVARNGYILVNWSNTLGDSVKRNTTSNQAKYVLDNLKNGDIILAHFGGYNTLAVMELIIPEIKKRGYELVTVSEVLEGM